MGKERRCSTLFSLILLRDNSSYLEVMLNCSHNVTNPAVLNVWAFVANDQAEGHLEEEELQEDHLGAMWRWRVGSPRPWRERKERRIRVLLLPTVLWSNGSYPKVESNYLTLYCIMTLCQI